MATQTRVGARMMAQICVSKAFLFHGLSLSGMRAAYPVW